MATRATGSVAALAAIAVLLPGCQRIFATTEAEFAKVEVNCVDVAIRRAAGAVPVSYGTGVNKAGVRSYWWDFGPLQPYIWLEHDGRSWKFSSRAMNPSGMPWSSETLEAISPISARVHAGIRRDCKLDIPTEITILRD